MRRASDHSDPFGDIRDAAQWMSLTTAANITGLSADRFVTSRRQVTAAGGYCANPSGRRYHLFSSISTAAISIITISKKPRDIAKASPM